MEDLKGRTIRGGFVKLCGQAASFVLRIAGMATLARLLDPQDFGLVAMVAVVTGVYQLFGTAGLSSAMVQKESITEQQISTLFWINLLIGTMLALLCLGTAPVLTHFYHEPRLFWPTVATGAGFIISAAAVQHSALLQRQLRYTALTVIEIVCLLVSLAAGISMALGGLGYWAIVGAALASSAAFTICVWVTAGWVPKMPRRAAGVRSMLGFGGTMTLNGLVVYVAYNLDKVLMGRFWGADVLGIYERAYRLINIPTEQLNSSIGMVAFSALARLQTDPVRLRSYFLKGYALLMSMTLPSTVFCAVFADDIILVVFGPNWSDAAIIFRLLTPTILIFGIINPIAWFLYSIGQQVRSLKIALVIAPVVILSYTLGLPYGASGVAFAYSAAMTLWLLPHIVWSLHGTMISPRDLFIAAGRPFLSAIVAAAVSFGAQFLFSQLEAPGLLRLVLGGGIMLGTYSCMLLFVMGQKKVYVDLFNGLRGVSSPI